MKDSQKLPPKYWIVHDKSTSDVFINTASKTRQDSIELFIINNSFNYFCVVKDDDLEELFLDHKDLACDLFELNRTLQVIPAAMRSSAIEK